MSTGHMARYRYGNVTSFTLVWIKIAMYSEQVTVITVTSFTLVWIKMVVSAILACWAQVTSFTLVWIKIPLVP